VETVPFVSRALGSFRRPLVAVLLAASALSPLTSPLTATAAFAQTEDPVDEAPADGVADGDTGFAVIQISSGKVLAAKEARKVFIPASVSKLPAALVILDRLGPAHQFHTTLQTRGTVKGGVLKGDLILVGGADPSLVHDDLAQMAAQLKAAGVTKVSGAFYYDASALPLIPQIEPRQPDTASYNPPIGGLSVDFSRYSVVWAKHKDGSVGAAKGADIALTSLPVKLPATVPPSLQVWLPVVDPGAFAAQVFAFYAAQNGIALAPPKALPVAGEPSEPGEAEPAPTVLVRHTSDPLSAILRDAMFYSNNMAMETLAMVATQSASPAAAGNAITKAVQQMVPNVGWGGFQMFNASGLTDQARMSPGQCAALTAYAATAEFDGLPFRSLLRGRKLDPFMADDATADAPLRTKTGTIYYARALSGVLTPQSKNDVAFCLMTNNIDKRAAYDVLPFDQRKDPAVRDPARAWTRAARKQEEGMVLDWAAKF
jgi:D-alanyl-D-alanine carboxypeptidase/D-alanyl-D-alanine-endopeptidase (penicillin-binding protein 4)